MITRLRYNNFKGQHRELALGPITAISGPNGSGKSTVHQAIDFALAGHVRNDGLGKDLPGVFEAYAGPDSAEVSVSLETDDARSLVRELKRSKKGAVSTSRLELDGQACSVRNGELAEMMGIKTFNATAFWSLSGTKQIAEVARIAGLDPEKLDKLDEEIEKANQAARTAEEALKRARAGLEEMRKQEQEAARPGDGQDLSRREARIKELRTQVTKLEKQFRAAERHNATLTDRQSRAAAIQAEIEQLAKERAGAPDPALIPTSDYQFTAQKILALEALQAQFRRREDLEKAIRQPMNRPTPPAYYRKDIEQIDAELATLATQIAVSTNADKVVMDVMKKIWARIRPSIAELPAFPVIQTAFKEETATYAQNIEKESRDKADVVKRNELTAKRASMLPMITAYEASAKAVLAEEERRMALKAEMATLDLDYSGLLELDALRNSYQVSKLKADERAAVVAAAERRDARMNDLLAQLTEMGAEMLPLDAAPIQEAQRQALAEIAGLEDSVRADERWRTIKASADAADKAVESCSMVARSARSKERDLQDEKAAMVATLKSTVEEVGSRVVAPASLEMEILAGRNGGMRLWLHLPGGRRVLRQAVSGAEAIELDVALSAALMGGSGVISAEVSEISEGRLQALVGKLATTLPAGTQVILTGHAIEHLASMPTVTAIAVGAIAVRSNEIEDGAAMVAGEREEAPACVEAATVQVGTQPF